MSPHRAGFTRSYSHRVIIKKISSNILVPTKTWLPNRVYMFNITGSPTLCSSPTWLTNIIHPQAKIINPQLSISKQRSKHQTHNDIEIYILNQNASSNINYSHTSYTSHAYSYIACGYNSYITNKASHSFLRTPSHSLHTSYTLHKN